MSACSARMTGLDLTIVNIFGTSYLADITSFDASTDITTKDGKPITALDAVPCVVGRAPAIELELYIPTPGTATLAKMALGTALCGTVNFATGGITYTGTAVLKSVRHRAAMEDLQTLSVRLEAVGGFVAL